MRRCVSAVALGVAMGLAVVRAVAQPTVAPFVAAPCDLAGVTPEFAPQLQCGTVAVPRQAGLPEAGVFRLAVVIIRGIGNATHTDPTLYIAGGPGAPLTAKAAVLASHEAGVVAPERDLVLVDQRGSGRSEPALCPGLANRQLGIFAAGQDEAVLVDAWRDSYAACRAAMAAAGLQPEWFGTQITAEDMETVRQALGIAHWNVYALSYGTAVAMTLMALHPDSLRAVVLDSVLPPDPLPMTLPDSFGRALALLFADCAAAHPALPQAYDAAVRGLDAESLDIPLPPGLGLEVFRLRGEMFRVMVNRALYSRAGMAGLPELIEAARDRDAAVLGRLAASAVRAYQAESLGVMAAVECRDRPSWRDAGPPIVPVSAFVSGMCAGWGPLGPPALLPRPAAVDALVLAGTADPITPPVFAKVVAEGLGSRATMVEFAHTGHGAQQASVCAEWLVTAFIRDPAHPLDTACAGQVPPVRFRWSILPWRPHAALPYRRVCPMDHPS